MTGIRRMSHEHEAEILRLARGNRLAQAADEDYKREVGSAESALGLR